MRIRAARAAELPALRAIERAAGRMFDGGAEPVAYLMADPVDV